MPTYEYIREDGEIIEVIQKFSDNPLTNCPDTGLKLKRKISGGSGVIYKGAGWYVTDYKNGNNSKDSKGNNEPKSSSDTPSTPTSENKTDTANVKPEASGDAVK